MLNRCYIFISKRKYRSKFWGALADSGFVLSIMYRWNIVRWYLRERPKLRRGRTDFYQQNAGRVRAIAASLADEKSRVVYEGMIKFRQTAMPRYYPKGYYDSLGYFIEEMAFGVDEVFIDCGAYDGDTVDKFLELHPNYKHIVAFEPGDVNFEHLQKKHGHNPKITLLKAGVWSKDDRLCFSGADAGVGGTFIGNTPLDATLVDVKSIDGLGLEKVTFIKMDIEGAELNALKGAKQTILRDKPKLAICIYHSDGEMLDIPEYLCSIAPEYKFYVRQHCPFPFMGDTVLYALP